MPFARYSSFLQQHKTGVGADNRFERYIIREAKIVGQPQFRFQLCNLDLRRCSETIEPLTVFVAETGQI